jgi:hypothetical protein
MVSRALGPFWAPLGPAESNASVRRGAAWRRDRPCYLPAIGNSTGSAPLAIATVEALLHDGVSIGINREPLCVAA